VTTERTTEVNDVTDDFLTNGWVQLAIAAGSLLGLICFVLMVRGGNLRFPQPGPS
jgi:hypothetical protein